MKQQKQHKATLVEWHVKGGDKREYYGIIAESIEGKEELRNQEFMVYDLEELNASYRSKGNTKEKI